MLPPHINSFTKGVECKLRYGGEEVYVQFGTKAQPFYSPFGMQYFDGKSRKFVSITRKTDTAFAVADALKFQSKSKVLSGKISAKLSLNKDYNEEGTQSYYANMFVNGIKDVVIDTLMNGAEDPSELDENGKPKIVSVVDDASLPKDREDRRNHFARIFEGALYQGNPDFPPSLQADARYVVKTDPETKQDVLTLATDMNLSTNPDELVPPTEHFDHLRPKHRGVFLLSPCNIKFDKKGKDIKSKFEIARCTIVPFKRRTFDGAEMLDDDEAAGGDEN